MPRRPTGAGYDWSGAVWAQVAVAAATLCALPLAAAGEALKPLSGEYGFLTEFDDISEEDARIRIRKMVDLFYVREFQFYDAMQGYSAPPSKDLERWHCRSFGQPVQRKILRAYIDEIRRCGGRSWIYLQAAATDPGDSQMQRGFSLTGQHVVDGRPLLDAVAPNSDWAAKIVPQWSEFAADLGFSGIHWDTLGKFSPLMAQFTDLSGFLQTAKPIMTARGLEQTANFVDGFGWDPSLIDDGQVDGRTISFAYWETWTLPDQEDFFYNQVAPQPAGGGVFVCYPGKTESHKGEWQNQAYVGIWPLDLMIQRWIKARNSGNAYLAVGDGVRHIETQYFPANAPISDADVAKIRLQVFGLPTSKSDFEAKPRDEPQPKPHPQHDHEPEVSTTLAPETTTTQPPQKTSTESCGTPQKDDICDVAVLWASRHGIWEHRDWYEGLDPQASYADFQNDLHKKGLEGCPRPCGLESEEGATTEAPTTTAPSPTTSTRPSTTTVATTLPPLPLSTVTPRSTKPDSWTCQEGLDNWAIQTQWPPAKQEWCCKHKQRGCFEMPSTAAPAAGTQQLQQFSWPAESIMEMEPSEEQEMEMEASEEPQPVSDSQVWQEFVGAHANREARASSKIARQPANHYLRPGIEAITSESSIAGFLVLTVVAVLAVAASRRRRHPWTLVGSS